MDAIKLNSKIRSAARKVGLDFIKKNDPFWSPTGYDLRSAWAGWDTSKVEIQVNVGGYRRSTSAQYYNRRLDMIMRFVLAVKIEGIVFGVRFSEMSPELFAIVLADAQDYDFTNMVTNIDLIRAGLEKWASESIRKEDEEKRARQIDNLDRRIADLKDQIVKLEAEKALL